MQDRELVAAVVAGDPDGIAATYDQFAAALYAHCHLLLSDPDTAADTVRDTFLIATARLEGLRDPDRLGSWLHAVARNECLRRLGAAGITSPPKVPSSAASDGALAGIELPATLRGQVIKTCTDNTPAGRAQRASVTHRAGSFGPTGFPRTIGSPGPKWWRSVRRHPRATVAVTVVAAVAAAAGIVVMLAAGGPHPTQASIVALGGGIPSVSAGAASKAGASSAASRRAAPARGQPATSVTAPAGVPSPNPPAGRSTPPSAVPASRASSAASPSAPPSRSPSPSPSPSASPARGTLVAVPGGLVLTAAKGKAVSGTFVLSAVGGPVSHYAISVPAGKVKVSPVQGSLAAGGWVTVTVTVTSKTAVDTHITVYPGAIAVTVRLTIRA